MHIESGNSMQGVILAGGRGKRLKPITDYVPKPLVPINNVPIIEWQIKYLKKFGVREIIICTGYKTEQIEDYLKSKNNLGVKISFSVEKTPLGTGGAIKKITKMIKGKTFFVINGDIITNIDIKKMKNKINAIAAIPLKTKFGTLQLKDDKIINFFEKKELSEIFMNAGIYHLSKNILKDLPNKGDIEKTLFPKYAKNNKLHNVKFTKSAWYSIDSFKDIEDCSENIQKIIK